nr:hypothetical protein [Tanacetum cinerariifolium]
MALPDKHQLKFNIHKDAKSLMEAIEKRVENSHCDLEEQSLDDLFNNLKIYEAEVNGSSTSSHNTKNIAFLSSNYTDGTNKSVSVVPSVLAASSKASVSTLPNLDNEDLNQIDADDLEEMDLKWQMAMLTMRARRFLQKTGRNLGVNGIATIRFDMSKVECYNFHRRCHFSRECRSPRENKNKDTPRRTIPVEVSTSNALVSQCDVVGDHDWSFQADEEPTSYVLLAYASSGSSSSSRSDNEVALCSKACSKAYPTWQTHYDKLTVDSRKSQVDVLSYKTESQVSDKTGLGYDSQLFNSQVFDYEEPDDSVPKSPVNDRYKSGEGYHVVLPPYTRTFMPPKPNFVCNDAPNASEIVTNVVNDKLSLNKPTEDMSKTLRPDAPIIKDWIFDSEDETENELNLSYIFGVRNSIVNDRGICLSVLDISWLGLFGLDSTLTTLMIVSLALGASLKTKSGL